MKIYLVSRTDNIGFDEYDGWVVIAETPAKARKLCQWGDAAPTKEQIIVSEIKPGMRSRIVLGSFNAG